MATAHGDAHSVTAACKLGGGGSHRFLLRFLSLFAGFSAWLAYPAWAAKWEFVPTVTLTEGYTDNVSLSADAVKQHQWITQVTPAISIDALGARGRFQVNYAPAITYYGLGQTDGSERRDIQVYQRLNATGYAELLKKTLFVDAGATVDQYNISLLGPITISNINTTGNVATAKSTYVSPYILREFGSAVRAEARFTYSLWESDSTAALSDSVSNRVFLRLTSGPAYKLLTWDLSYSKEAIDYADETVLDPTSEVSSATARRLITPTLGLLASAGYENYANTFGPGSNGPSWAVGFDWAPTARTRLIATGGERFYGDVYTLDFKHRTRLTAWGVTLSQNITTTRSLFFIPGVTSTADYLDTLFTSQYPDPAARKKAVEEFIDQTGLPPGLNGPTNAYVNQLFVNKNLTASVGILGVRNVLLAFAFDQTNEGLVGNTVISDAPLANRQTGASFVWNWRITARNAWNLSGSYTRNQTPSIGQIYNAAVVSMGLSRQFQPRLSGSLSYRRQQGEANVAVTDYTENAVFATLRIRF